MALVKNFNSSYTLNGPQVTITGNLTVLGNSAQVNSNVTSITDNFITLNAGETGNGVSIIGTTSGVLIDRGTAAGGNVSLRWNETTSQWQISGVTAGSPGDGSQYSTITTSSSGSTTVFDDKAPVLGGNLNTNGYTFYANTNSIFSANVQFNNVSTLPGAVTNATVLYASTPGGGTAGLYVVNSLATNQELVTKTRALGFSLLF